MCDLSGSFIEIIFAPEHKLLDPQTDTDLSIEAAFLSHLASLIMERGCYVLPGAVVPPKQKGRSRWAF